MTRVDLAAQDPASLDALGALNSQIDAAASAAGLDLLTLELLKVRVSQVNGCASCLRLHTRGAQARRLPGAPRSRRHLARVPVLQPCRGGGVHRRGVGDRISDGPMSDALYDEVATVLTDEQHSALAWAAIEHQRLEPGGTDQQVARRTGVAPGRGRLSLSSARTTATGSEHPEES